MIAKKNSDASGFTLIELMIVVAIISIIASLAIPNLLSAKKTSNEGATIAALRNIASVQVQCSGRGFIDADSDGQGEYAFFGELSGGVPARNAVGIPLSPTLLGGSFTQTNGGFVQRSGYLLCMYLPDNAGVGLAESPANYANVDANLAEQIWCAYAWPVDPGSGGVVYFINQNGEILRSQNTNNYGGVGSPPPYDAAFAVAGSMATAVATGVAGSDGAIWNVLR
ncbi:MAG: prepilin-type N-terminal cleavage/methylation domain-containing protein [Planctomycetota bacterium]|jgi:prepilin-type N-terminal cleavage/methylation domain-containing protein